MSAKYVEVAQRGSQRRYVRSLLNGVTLSIQCLLYAWCFSILFEWVGMVWFWSEEGALHSERMLLTEVQYLNRDFRESLLSLQPSSQVQIFSEKVSYYLFEWTGLLAFLGYLEGFSNHSNVYLRNAYEGYQMIQAYIYAAMNMTQLVAVRLGILLLSLPAFVLFGLVGFIKGLVSRDIRRWSGGREGSDIYHIAKRFIIPLFISAWMIYLSLPVSIHPSFIVLPCAVLFGLAIMVTASTFKKYFWI